MPRKSGRFEAEFYTQMMRARLQAFEEIAIAALVIMIAGSSGYLMYVLLLSR